MTAYTTVLCLPDEVYTRRVPEVVEQNCPAPCPLHLLNEVFQHQSAQSFLRPTVEKLEPVLVERF